MQMDNFNLLQVIIIQRREEEEEEKQQQSTNKRIQHFEFVKMDLVAPQNHFSYQTCICFFLSFKSAWIYYSHNIRSFIDNRIIHWLLIIGIVGIHHTTSISAAQNRPNDILQLKIAIMTVLNSLSVSRYIAHCLHHNKNNNKKKQPSPNHSVALRI